jgi:hypothetical protein
MGSCMSRTEIEAHVNCAQLSRELHQTRDQLSAAKIEISNLRQIIARHRSQ